MTSDAEGWKSRYFLTREHRPVQVFVGCMLGWPAAYNLVHSGLMGQRTARTATYLLQAAFELGAFATFAWISGRQMRGPRSLIGRLGYVVLLAGFAASLPSVKETLFGDFAWSGWYVLIPAPLMLIGLVLLGFSLPRPAASDS